MELRHLLAVSKHDLQVKRRKRTHEASYFPCNCCREYLLSSSSTSPLIKVCGNFLRVHSNHLFLHRPFRASVEFQWGEFQPLSLCGKQHRIPFNHFKIMVRKVFIDLFLSNPSWCFNVVLLLDSFSLFCALFQYLTVKCYADSVNHLPIWNNVGALLWKTAVIWAWTFSLSLLTVLWSFRKHT